MLIMARCATGCLTALTEATSRPSCVLRGRAGPVVHHHYCCRHHHHCHLNHHHRHDSSSLIPTQIKIIVIIIIIIIITRPKPAYGRHGLAGSWGQDTDEVSTFLVFLTSRFVPAAPSSDLNQPGTITNNKNPPRIMKTRPGAMKTNLEQLKTSLEP